MNKYLKRIILTTVLLIFLTLLTILIATFLNPFTVSSSLDKKLQPLGLLVVIILPFILRLSFSKLNNALTVSGILSFIIFMILGRIEPPYKGMGSGFELFIIVLLSFIYLISGLVDKLSLLKKK